MEYRQVGMRNIKFYVKKGTMKKISKCYQREERIHFICLGKQGNTHLKYKYCIARGGGRDQK